MKPRNGCLPLDIAPAANRGFRDLPGAGLAGGWTGQGENDLRGLRPGMLKAGKLEFAVLDPAANGNRAVIALRHDDPAFVGAATIAVDRTTGDWIYLLQATSWIAPGVEVGRVTIRYEAGADAVVSLTHGVEVADWWGDEEIPAARRLPVNDANPVKSCVSLYACGIRNPFPRQTIREIVLTLGAHPRPEATWLILAAAAGTGRSLLTGNRNVKLRADLAQTAGTIRGLHGANIGAPLFIRELRDLINGYLKELAIPFTRMHDCPWDNAGLKLIDVHQIFPLFHADPADPKHYFFKQTDDYIKSCLATGSKVNYRLGSSIEHMENSYFAVPPADYEKWAEICIQIIRHYNEGWAEGFRHNIEYWEIWNEPNLGRQMWTGTWDDYLRLYVTASKRIKARFPEIKVGGPGLTAAIEERIAPFLAACRQHDAPLDFFSWHRYGSNVETIVREPAFVRKLLDAQGFRHTELHLNEWHYTRGAWAMAGAAMAANDAEWNGIDGAAYLCAVLSGWQDTPLDMGHYYSSSIMPRFGLFNGFGVPNKCYYGMKAFACLMRYNRRFAVEVVSGERVWALGGRDARGAAAILLACQGGPAGQIRLRIDHARLAPAKLQVRCLDAQHDLAPTAAFAVNGDTVKLRKAPGSSVFLLELEAEPLRFC